MRKTQLIRGGDYWESVFYQADQQIARQKISAHGVEEQEGEIPDGRVKFLDDASKTYGEEYYKNGKKYGLSKTYYASGQLMKEENYEDGKLQTGKEYYDNGSLRFEVDYQDKRDCPGNKGEVGVGKLYFKNGVLRYEWNLTRTSRTGFKKSYNRNGELTLEAYYDEKCQLIQPRDDFIKSATDH